jgi:hypothetical protein
VDLGHRELKVDMQLSNEINHLIKTGKEGAYLNFNRQHHTNKGELGRWAQLIDATGGKRSFAAAFANVGSTTKLC